MPTRTKSKTRTPRATKTPSAPRAPDARTARAKINALRRDREQGEPVDLAALHDAFEALRDAATQPTRLFALAVEEARVTDEVLAGAADKEAAGEALLVALLRVLEGDASGVETEGLGFALERTEALLRSAIGRALPDEGLARTLGALTNGYVLAGDPARALNAAGRWVRRAERLANDDARGMAELRRALSRAFETAILADDVSGAQKWARAAVDVERDAGDARDDEALADACGALAAALAEAGPANKALAAAREWVDAERAAAATAPHRAGRVMDALAAVSHAAAAQQDGSAWLESADAWVTMARAAMAERDDTGERAFAAARLADALGELTEARAHAGDREGALVAAREWAEAERTAAGGAMSVRSAPPLASAAFTLAEMGDWGRCAEASDALLAVLRGPERAKGARKGRSAAEPTDVDPVARALRPRALALAARAHFAVGRDDSAREAAEAYRDTLGAEGDDAPDALATVAAVAAALDLATAKTARPGAVRTRAISSAVARAKQWVAAVDAIPSSKRDPAARAVTLAYLAHAEMLADSTALAQRHATESLRKLRDADEAPREAVAFVAYVHETVLATRPQRRTARELDPSALAARALAAADAGDTARASTHLASLDPDALRRAPDALAHTLAAGCRVLAALAPDDPEHARCAAAFREVAHHGTVGSGRGQGAP